MMSSFHWIDFSDEVDEIITTGESMYLDEGTSLQMDKFLADFEEYFDVALAIREGGVVIVA
jgi:hypothetical protein